MLLKKPSPETPHDLAHHQRLLVMHSPIVCPQCGITTWKKNSAINRAASINAPLYCDKTCAGLARRKPEKTIEQKKAEKKAYDALYRAKNLERILQRNAEYHKRTYDPQKAAIARKKRMPKHVEYCRRPEYKAYKHEYDLRYHNERSYGPFWQAAQILNQLEKTLREHATHTESRTQNGTLNKSIRRKRDYTAATQDQSRPKRARYRK